MKTQIDLSPEKNLARNSAFQHAQDRAARENKPMRVYVGPPGSGCMADDGLNVWFVRAYDEPAPDRAELFREITPSGCPIVTDEHVKNMARHHVAYNWARSPGSHDSKRVWTAAHLAAYNAEYDRCAELKRAGKDF